MMSRSFGVRLIAVIVKNFRIAVWVIEFNLADPPMRRIIRQ